MYEREPVETVEHLGLTIKVYPDDTGGTDPRGWDNVGTMLCWHPRYDLGDEQFSGPEDVGGSRTMQDVARWMFRERKALVLLPLYLYDHSGITIRAGGPIYRQTRKADKDDAVRSSGRFMEDGAGWDTSMVGYIYATRESADAAGIPDDRIVDCLRGEVTDYDNYLTGNVYGYTIEDHSGETLWSCWGFFPDHDPTDGLLRGSYREPWAEALEEAKAEASAIATSLAVAP